jgi:hypothetical protein
METTEKLNLQNLSVNDMKKLVKDGYSIDSLFSQYKDYIFEKHKDESLAIKWACLAGLYEGIVSIMLKNSIEDDTRI